jgi:GNAT superfamily N-acetyltransferase
MYQHLRNAYKRVALQVGLRGPIMNTLRAVQMHPPQKLTAPASASAAGGMPRTSLSMLMLEGIVKPPSQTASPAPGAGGQKPGAMLLHGFEGLDLARAKALIEASFGRELVEWYFTMQASPARVLVMPDYTGIAIIKGLGGADYLDKIAVAPEKKGNGVGKALWGAIRSECPSLIWRATLSNPANAWYGRNSEGMVQSGEWKVFWYGMDAARAFDIIPLVASMPKTII